MSDQYSEVTQVARDYYNSEDADNFYYLVWGGEDLHIGIYNTPDESIADASQRTMDHMVRHVTPASEHRILDLGGGYGGSARYLARHFQSPVVVLNLSEKENERGREANKAQGLDHLVEIVDGDFQNVPYEDESFDVVWSQDAILHSDDRDRVIAEAARVLKPGGDLVFTDPMMKDDCPTDVIQPILDRIHLSTLGSPKFYREAAARHGLTEMGFEDLTNHLPTHYGRVREETQKADQSGILEGKVSREYIDRMIQGLGHWVDGGNNGYLTWGIFHFRKK